MAGIEAGAEVNLSDEDIGEKAFNNPPSDLTPARKAILQGHIGLGENQIGEIAFRNSPGDLTAEKKAEVRNHIDAQEALSDSSIGDRAFSNPPSNLTTDEKEAVITAIGAPDVPTAPGAGSNDLQYNLQVTTGGVVTWEQDTGGGANSGEQNVQSDWTETDTASDAFIQNKPTIPAAQEASDWNATSGVTRILNKPTIPTVPTDEQIGDKAFSNPPTDLTDTEKTAARNAIGAGTGSGGGGGLSTVSTDATITGDGSSASPLSVANAFTDADETKLDGIATGAEVNVQSDWDETDTDSDAYIDNKPDLFGRYLGDWSSRTAYNKGDVLFSTGQFWRAKQDVPDNRTGAPTNDLDYWQQSSFSIGMVSTLPAFVDNDEFDLNRDRWVILTAAQTLTGTRSGTGVAPYVADVQDVRSVSDVTSNQITQLNRGDIMRVDTWPTRYWARMVNAAVPNVPDAPAAQTDARNYNLQISSAGVASWQQDTGGGGTNTGEANVQSDWSETNTASDAFILNKPTIPSIPTDEQIGDKAFSNPPTTLTDDEKEAARTAIGAGTGTGTGTLTSVSTDTTITGDGTTGSPLAVANPFTDADETKLDGIAAGAEVNVQSDWNATSGDAQILNKPTIPTIPGNATDSVAGLMSALDKDKLDSIASSAEVNVQSDWNQTNTTNDSYIQNKPTIPTLPTDSEIGDKAFSNPPTDLTDAEKTVARNAIGAGTGSGTGGEENVQSDWNVTDTNSDAFILNKPTIPTLPTDSEIGDKAFSNPPTDLDDAEQANVRTNIGLTNSNIGVLAFRNPPSNLTSTQQTAVRTAIGAGTGSGGTTTFTGLTDTPASLGTAGQFLRVNTGATALEFVAAPSGTGASTFEALTDTPASLGSAGQYLRVNSAGNALEFVAAPTGGGSATSNYLPPPDERSTDGGFYYMGWTDNFNNSWGIRRISLSTGAATTATVANNSVVTDLAGAWSARTTLTYG